MILTHRTRFNRKNSCLSDGFGYLITANQVCYWRLLKAVSSKIWIQLGKKKPPFSRVKLLILIVVHFILSHLCAGVYTPDANP